MKARIIVSIFAAAALMFSQEMNAQQLDKENQEKAIKEARKEAKLLEKEGYKVPAGALALTRQLEDAWQAQVTVDTEGTPYYLMAEAISSGPDYDQALKSAASAAKSDLADQVLNQILSVLQEKVADNKINADNADAISTFVSASKSVIDIALGGVTKFIEIYRTLEDGTVQAQVTLGYNAGLAVREVITTIQETLDSDAEDLIKELDILLQ